MEEITITPKDLANLRHMLGVRQDISQTKWGYRNHFAPAGKNIPSMERLAEAGLAVPGKPYLDSRFFHATRAGAELAGLAPEQINSLFV